jgi:RNA-directed DNA polymerase
MTNKQISVLDCLGFYTQIKKEDIKLLINKAPTNYRIYKVKKHSNRSTNYYRTICQPDAETKMLQYALLNYYFMDIPENECAMAYVRGKKSPLYKNAIAHKDFLYTVHYDFTDFFNSIDADHFFKTIEKDFDFSDEDIVFITKICFIKRYGVYRLAIGAPISPKFSNLYMRKFDSLLNQITVINNGRYTRYADDVLYSSNKKSDIDSFKKKMDEILKTDLYDNLKINNYKTRLYKPNRPKKITGLLITEKHEIKVPRKIKRETRELIYKGNKRNDKETLRLKGLIAYIKDVEPSYINSLISKYRNKYFEISGKKNFSKTVVIETLLF